MKEKFIAVAGIAIGVGVYCSGCTIRETTSPAYAEVGVAAPVYAEVEVGAPPPEIEVYPNTVYRGETVYYYRDHWYHRRGGRWVYWRDEPGDLRTYRQRQRIGVEYAPPARHHHHHH